MAHNEYYTYTQGRVNGKILMNVQVFDEITKRTVNEMRNVSLDTSKGIQIPGTKKVVNCTIKDNEVYICIHVRIKYGVNISSITKEISNDTKSWKAHLINLENKEPSKPQKRTGT